MLRSGIRISDWIAFRFAQARVKRRFRRIFWAIIFLRRYPEWKAVKPDYHRIEGDILKEEYH